MTINMEQMLSVCRDEMVRGAASLKVPMTFAWVHGAGIWALGLGFEPGGWDFSLKAGILDLKLELGLNAGIWSSRLRFRPQS